MSSSMRVAVLVATVLVMHLVASRASADTRPTHILRWTRGPGAESCIDAQMLATAVEERLGRVVFAEQATPAVIIEAHVARATAGWHVAIAVRSADGKPLGARELDEPAADCRALDEALSLVIALIVDP